MNAETLIGTVLGTCTLQKLIGQGGMGAVFLAQQTRPRRQVAVKVLLPMIPLNPDQLAAFLERFRRETDAAAGLEHPNIMPVHEYGECGGLAYLVMPYISGGTLRDVLERDGPLPLTKAANYLEQIAAAVDSAHDHGVIHRDIKPANIMVTPEGRLLLGDFGLVKIIAEGQSALIRLTGAGAPVGTPDYMAPEQVIGEDVDTRADLYSLGILLFQMVTGTTPFRGETPMQIAAQHLRLPPPSPLMLRPDLPIRAEQVIQRAMAKKPVDRYLHANDLANAFRQALLDAGIQLESSTINGLQSSSTGRWRALPKRQFEPIRQKASLPKPGMREHGGNGLQHNARAMPEDIRGSLPDMPAMSEEPPLAAQSPAKGLLARTEKGLKTGTMGVPTTPSDPNPTPTADGSRLLSRTGKFPMIGANIDELPVALAEKSIAPTSHNLATHSDKQPSVTPTLKEQSPAIEQPSTETLREPETPQKQHPTKLTNLVTVTKAPLAGKLGQRVMGHIPVTPPLQAGSDAIQASRGEQKHPQPWMNAVLVIVTLLAIFAAVDIMFFGRTPLSIPLISRSASPPNMTATTIAHQMATTQTNILLADPLNRNVHNWYTDPPNVYAFKNGAYHITVSNNQDGQASMLRTNSFDGPLGYQLTWEEISGDDTDANNSFGMIFRFSQQNTKKNINGDPIITFYSFEVTNIKGGEYDFWKYDNTNPSNPWTEIQDGKLAFGHEFHQGHGPQAVNTIKIFMNGDKFTVTVNGVKLSKTFQDVSLTKGMVGMIVNLKGTEVAFSHLLITRN